MIDVFAFIFSMNEILKSLSFNDSLILTAPPGWGKTYRLLDAIKNTQVKVFFIFPLRALCDEVYLAALDKGIRVLNLRTFSDYDLLKHSEYDLIVSTPELVQLSEKLINFVFILDEFHLFYYWGDTFRDRMKEIYMEITSYSVPIIFLTATLNEELKSRLEMELKFNYDNIIHIDIGNQKLKNYPHKIFYYPKLLNQWLVDDYQFSSKSGTSLIFCKYREEVKELSIKLRSMGHMVLSCVGGEASEFMNELQNNRKIDYIVATSVVSHGVNLPNISNLYFTYKVDNLDFYLQMIGRGGRSGANFNIHIKNNEYFGSFDLFNGFIQICLKRLGNKMNSLLY